MTRESEQTTMRRVPYMLLGRKEEREERVMRKRRLEEMAKEEGECMGERDKRSNRERDREHEENNADTAVTTKERKAAMTRVTTEDRERIGEENRGRE